MTTDPEQTESDHSVELTERQVERFEQVREECDEPGVPEPTDQQVMKGLLDTWDAVNEGHYSDGNPVLEARVRKLEERNSDKTAAINVALEALRDHSGPTFYRLKNAERHLKPFEVREDDGLRADGSGEYATIRHPDDLREKIDELRAYNDYGRGPSADNLRYKHKGWIDALRWVLGSDLGVEP